MERPYFGLWTEKFVVDRHTLYQFDTGDRSQETGDNDSGQ